MFSERVFQITLLISAITHGVILFQNTNFSLFSRDKKEEKLEVSYIKEEEKPPEDKKSNPAKREPLLKIPSQIKIGKKLAPPPFVEQKDILAKDNESVSRKISFAKPAIIKPDIIAIKKKITLPPLDMNKINNPSYIGYYQIVREKIRRAAYQNYTRTEEGEVYLSFLISNDGYIKEVRLVGEKSSANSYLREIALRSIKDASPFPNFPKELDYPQLSFNVVISFEIE